MSPFQSVHITLIACLMLVGLNACGGPSTAAIQATVEAAVQATAQAAQVAASVQATQEAEHVCGATALAQYADSVEDKIRLFDQQAQLVGATPRASLGAPLQRLLDIQTETRQLAVPACLQPYHDRVVTMMDLHQQAFQNFAAQGSEQVTTNTLQQAKTALETVRRDLTTIKAGEVPQS